MSLDSMPLISEWAASAGETRYSLSFPETDFFDENNSSKFPKKHWRTPYQHLDAIHLPQGNTTQWHDGPTPRHSEILKESHAASSHLGTPSTPNTEKGCISIISQQNNFEINTFDSARQRISLKNVRQQSLNLCQWEQISECSSQLITKLKIPFFSSVDYI